MRKLVVLLGMLVGAAVWAVPAFAQEPVDPGTLGYIEVCKTTGADIAAGTLFGFSIPAAVDASQRSVTVASGACSSPIEVAGTPGTDGTFQTAVTEASAPWFSISGISVTTNYNGATTSVPTSTTSFTVMGGASIAAETRVTYTNVLVTGFIEVCKAPAANSGLTSGEFSFRIQAGLNAVSNSFMSDQTIAVPLNQCSSPIAVPAGAVTVTETGGGVFITNVTVSGGGNSSPATVTDNGVTVNVAASTTPGSETLVRFFDALSTLKICKIGGTNGLGAFTGSVSFTIGGAATTSATVASGPAGSPGCVQIGSVIPGSTISISEGPTVGAMVSAVDLNGGTAGLTTSLAAGTVSFSAVNGANVVTYTNVLATPVPVKVCKAGAAAGAVIPLSISGVAGQGFRGTATTSAASITIPSTGGTACTDLLGPFAYGSTLAVTETAPAGTALASASVTGNAGPTATVSGSTASITVGAFGSTASLAILTLTNAAASSSSAIVVSPVSGGGGGGPSGSPSTPPSTSGSSNGGTSSSTPSPTTTPAPTTTGSTSALTGTPSVVKSPAVVKLVTARFVVIAHGKLAGRWIGVQLKGNTPTATVKILLVGRNGKSIGTLIRTVKTGQFVRVAKVATSIKSVKVSTLKI
jgi:hypothetical protein